MIDGAWGMATGSAAVVAGGDRFRLWQGRSGRRHVFSRVERGAEPADLDGAVVVITGRVGAALRPLWVGRAEQAPLGGLGGAGEVFAHWLAEGEAERSAVIADLGGNGFRAAA